MRKRDKGEIIIWFVWIGSIIGLLSGWFIKTYWIPDKYAIKENEFSNYEPYILVQEVHYTGTGWVQVGDESGYFSSADYQDVYLTNGTVLPQMHMYNDEYANTFLCKIEYIGKMNPFEDEEVDAYRIVEWYPVYPVLRDTILPSWMFPKSFIAKEESCL